MRQLLIINPNTSPSVSELLQIHAQRAAGPQVRVRTVTARFGAPYIACEASYAVAAHATLDAWAAALANSPAEDLPTPDAVLIGCFGDPGLLALRETSVVPVTGLADAAFAEAARHGRFAIVTGGERWKPMLTRLAHTLGHDGNLAGIHAVAPTGAQLANDPVAARSLLLDACRQAMQAFQVNAIILGGAGLAGMAEVIAQKAGFPVIDSVLAGAQHALRSTTLADAKANGRFDVAWQNVSSELAARGMVPVRA
jgi:Asp/Glu/hydantoin racemase